MKRNRSEIRNGRERLTGRKKETQRERELREKERKKRKRKGESGNNLHYVVKS